MISPPLPEGVTKVKIVEREWGIERCYISSKGIEICTPAPYYAWPFFSK